MATIPEKIKALEDQLQKVTSQFIADSNFLNGKKQALEELLAESTAGGIPANHQENTPSTTV